MSLVFNMVGGGGGISINKAIIHVRAVVASTVTISTGGVIVKELSPDDGIVNSDSTYEDYYYSVSASNYGTYTVQVQKGILTGSRNISVNDAKQYDVVDPSLSGYLYNTGTSSSSYTHDLIKNSGVLTEESSYIQIQQVTGTSSYQYYRVYNVNLTDVKTIRMTGTAYCSHSGDGATPRIFITQNASVTWASDGVAATAGNVVSTSYASFNVALNVSSYSGTYYVACGHDTWKSTWNYNRYVRISTISLER